MASVSSLSSRISQFSLSDHYPPLLMELFEKTEKNRLSEYYEICRELPKVARPEFLTLSLTHLVGSSIILSQAPTEFNLPIFFDTIYEMADSVITLTQDKDYTKDNVFFPYTDFLFHSCEKYIVKKVELASGIIKASKLEITPNDSDFPVKEVPHYHYGDWLDGADADLGQIVELAKIAMEAKKPLIHCIAGLGRTGTLVSVILAYQNIKEGDHSSDLIQKTVMDLRKERPGVVTSPLQYLAIYKTLEILLQEDGLLPVR